jgi:DNA-binding transcriptional LysR family regulator
MARHGTSVDTASQGQVPTIELLQLRYAVSAADHGSFRRAAIALRLRQSTLSRRVRRLEETVGLVVFDRSSGGVRVTPAGRNFLRTARSILEQIDALVTTAHNTGRGEAGRLAIGFYTSLSAGNFRATLVELTQRFPLMELDLIEGSRARIVTALRSSILDAAVITTGEPIVGCAAMPLWSERIVAALPLDHRLASNTTLYWTDLRDQTLLLSQRDPGPELRDLVIGKLASPRDRPKIVSYDVSGESLRNLVAAGFGVSLTTEASVGAFPGVTYREVRDGTGPVWVGYSAHWRASNDNPALTSFLQLLAERYPLPANGT